MIWGQKGFYPNNYYQFCFLVFLIVFEIFCIFIIFQIYKQSKYEYKIKLGYINNENNNNEINANIQENNEENNDIERLPLRIND